MQKKKYKRKIKRSVFIISFVSFFLARAVLFDSIDPVCIAFLGCFCGMGASIWSSFIMTVIGLITNSGGIYLSKYLISAIFVLIFNTVLQKRIKYSPAAKAFTSSASILSGGLIMAMLNDFSLYYTVIAVLESILTFGITIIFDTGIRFLTDRKKRIVASQEEMISLSLIAASIIIGAADIHIGDIPIVYALCITLTMFVSYCTHAAVGASAAIFTGLLLIMSRNAASESAVILAGASAAAGAYNKKNKIVFILIYVSVGAFMLYFLKKSMFDVTMLISAVLGVALFLVIPAQASYIFRNSSENDTSDTEAYIERLKDVTKHRLNSFSSSFEKLAKTFSVLSEKRSSLDKNDISRLIDDISDRTCKKCSMRYFCWEKNFYKTYQTIFMLLNSLESYGYLTKELLPVEFMKDCADPLGFIENTNKLYEVYKTNLAWENKMIESRELVAQQLTGVSRIIDSLSREIDFDLKFKENISAAVKRELEDIGEENVSVTASENREEKTELLIKHRCCGCERVCTSRIIPAVNKVLGKTMARTSCDCVISKNNICTLRLCEAKKFHITTSVARSSKNVGKVSGDSYSFMPIGDGKYMLLLSDGMGSGMKAHEESAATIELFEDFMSAGFDRKTAIDIINSVLVMRSAGDNFSTMDICTIDLYTGAAEFVKIGAAAAFILRDGNVDVIGSSSLPIGILNNVEAETRKRRLKDGDIIVMMTDGITDAFSGKENKSDEIKSILRKYHGTNPGELADHIIERAKEAGGISDDMTVLTARIWKSV